MAGKESFLKFLDMLIDEEERAKVFREYLEEKTGYSVYVEKVGIPGINDAFEFHNLKLSSPDGKVRINSELLRLSSSKLYSLIAAGKILLNSSSDIPLERFEAHGVFLSLGPEEDADFELFSTRAFFRGISLKIRYDGVTHEPECTGTLSSEEMDAELTFKRKGVRIPTLNGTAQLSFNLKTLTGNCSLELEGGKKGNDKGEGRTQKNGVISLDYLGTSLRIEFTLYPYSR